MTGHEWPPEIWRPSLAVTKALSVSLLEKIWRCRRC